MRLSLKTQQPIWWLETLTVNELNEYIDNYIELMKEMEGDGNGNQ